MKLLTRALRALGKPESASTDKTKNGCLLVDKSGTRLNESEANGGRDGDAELDHSTVHGVLFSQRKNNPLKKVHTVPHGLESGAIDLHAKQAPQR